MSEGEERTRREAPEDRITERVAAILAADAVGYSRLMADDEAATVKALDRARNVFKSHIEANRGRLVDTAGDSVLAVFDTTSGAVRASIAIQEGIQDLNTDVPAERQMHFRIGIHLGDIMEKDADGTVYGDGVNVAARLEGLSDPGAITVSASVRESVRERVEVGFEFLGEHQGKNLKTPVKAYRVLAAGTESAPPTKLPLTIFRRPKIMAGVVSALVVAVGILTWQLARPTNVTSSSDGQIVEGSDEGITAEISVNKDLPTIAVLPFDNLSGAPEDGYFADGITEDLISLLAQYQYLAVIARNSTFTYKDRAVDVRVVGEEMGADFVLEGSARRAGDRIRVSAQLLSASDGKNLWGKTYDRDLTVGDVFDLQDELTSEVASKIAGAYGIIAQSRTRDAERISPENFSSYDCVLKYYEFNRLVDAPSHLAARTCLEHAVVKDPTYADAFVYLSAVYMWEYALGLNPRPSSMDRARAEIQKAILLDPLNPKVIEQDAYLLYLNRDPRFFDRAREAVAANPRDGTALANMGFRIAMAGEWEQGIGLVDRAFELTPVPPGWWYMVKSDKAFMDGDYELALELDLKVNMPGYFWYHAHLARTYELLGRHGEAQQQAKLLLDAYPDFEQTAYAEHRKWWWDDDLTEKAINAFRAAGLDIPPDPAKVN